MPRDPLLQDTDYVSPGLRVVMPDASFPRMRCGDRWSHPWKLLRRDVAHTWYADERFPLMGFVNRDEATILHNVALQFAGRPALEIGSWLGWSTCHLALAGVRLDVLDPAHADPAIHAIVNESLAHCAVLEQVNLTALRSPDGVHGLAADRPDGWNLFVIDGDHEPPAPELDARACLAYAHQDCAFVFHDLASPAVAAGLRFLQREGFHVLIYQTAQIMGLAWRGRVTPVAHVPDPAVSWQLPHHLVGLPVSGVTFDARSGGRPSLFLESLDTPGSPAKSNDERLRGERTVPRSPYRQLRDVEYTGGPQERPSVCIVSSEIIGPFKNGGIGTAMTGLAEHLAASGCAVTVLYTGSIWRPDVPLRKWIKRYEELGVKLIPLSLDQLTTVEGPLKDWGLAIPYLVYRFLDARHFDVVHFNDCAGEGSLCLAAKKLCAAFPDTVLLVALHSPSQWVLELNQTLPISLMLSAYNYAERLSVRAADVLWSPSTYLLDWALRRGFALPEQTVVQQYCLPSPRLGGRTDEPAEFPRVTYGHTPPPREIVFFGRLEERKGLRLFCNAIHTLREELADRTVSVTFLGKAETCAGMGSLEYIARRSAGWRFRVRTMTNLGQPEALAYLRGGGAVAVMPARIDNSPCTVYEALAWGIPFLAARTGGVPELVHADDRDAVLFECTTDALVASLRRALEGGGWIARPSQPQDEARRAWSSFHAHSTAFLPAREADPVALPLRVVAIVDAPAGADLGATLTSMAAVPAIHHVVVLNRDGVSLPAIGGTYSLTDIDLSVSDPEALSDALATVTDDAVLLIHAGIGVYAEAFAEALLALGRTDIDGLVPAADVQTGGSRKIVPPLGGHPAFTFFEGVTFTGGLLVRSGSLRRAMAGRSLTADSVFMGLADFCVTRGSDIWPYPQPVFEQPHGWTLSCRLPLPARVMAYDECSPTDRYYMLAAGSATHGDRPGGQNLRAALTMMDLGLGRLIPFAARTVRGVRGLRARLSVRRLGRLLWSHR